jgi:hypothetical protein
MMQRKRIVATAALAALLASGVRAADDELKTEARTPNPGGALAAALLNVVFLPVRLPLTVLGAGLAGLTGFLTFGGKHAADDVFGLVDGTQVIDKKVLDGRERFRIGRYD